MAKNMRNEEGDGERGSLEREGGTEEKEREREREREREGKTTILRRRFFVTREREREERIGERSPRASPGDRSNFRLREMRGGREIGREERGEHVRIGERVRVR